MAGERTSKKMLEQASYVLNPTRSSLTNGAAGRIAILLLCVTSLCACRAAIPADGPQAWDPEVELSARLPYVVSAEVPPVFSISSPSGKMAIQLSSADPTLLLGYTTLSQNQYFPSRDASGKFIPYEAGAAVLITPYTEYDYENRVWTIRPWIADAPLIGEPSADKNLFPGIPAVTGTWKLRIESAATPEQGGLIERAYMFTPAQGVGRLVDGPPGETIYREYAVEVVE